MIDESTRTLKTKGDYSSPTQHSCIAYKDGRCQIYDKRPLICRGFPIQIVRITELAPASYSPYSDQIETENVMGLAAIINGCLAAKEKGNAYFDKQIDEVIELYKKAGLLERISNEDISRDIRQSYLKRSGMMYRIIKE